MLEACENGDYGFKIKGMLLLVDFFNIIILQEMYTQAGPQFRDELHRHNLPSSLVNINRSHFPNSLLFDVCVCV